MKSKEAFCEEVGRYIKGIEQDQALNTLIIDNDSTHTGIELAETCAETGVLNHEQPRSAKRPSSNNNDRPEVDPLPPAVKKQKQSDSGGKDKEHADKEFLQLVTNEYLIREGKYDFNIATIGAIICDEGPS